MITGLDGVNQKGNAVSLQNPAPRMVRAAHEFEAQMMKELLAPMTCSDALFAADDGEDTGILGEFATESLAGALSAGGGLGIANRIIHALSSASGAGAEPGVVTGQNNMGISPDK